MAVDSTITPVHQHATTTRRPEKCRSAAVGPAEPTGEAIPVPVACPGKLDAGLPVDEFTHDIEVTVVAGDLFDEVQDHPAQVHVAAVAEGTYGR